MRQPPREALPRTDSAAETVLATPELYALIVEHVFDPVRGFTPGQLHGIDPPVRHDLATLASLARVNRALARMPWPSAAGTAHVALSHEAEAERRRRRFPPTFERFAVQYERANSPDARAARAPIEAKLELGLAAVARACGALDQELAAAGDGHCARAPGSAAERAYRACLLFSAVDAEWRAPPYDGRIERLLLEPPPQLARALCAHGTNARLPAELRAASLGMLGVVISRLEQFVCRSPRPWEAAAVAAQARRFKLVRAELNAVYSTLSVCDLAASADSAFLHGPLALALALSLEYQAFGKRSSGALRRNAEWHELIYGMHPSLCALLANPSAPAGARSCAAAAIERFARCLINDFEQDESCYFEEVDEHEVDEREYGHDELEWFLDELKASGASKTCDALWREVEGATSDVSDDESERDYERPSPSTLAVMPASRANLIFASSLLSRAEGELQEVIKEQEEREANEHNGMVDHDPFGFWHHSHDDSDRSEPSSRSDDDEY